MNQTHVSCIGRQGFFFFTTEPPGKPFFVISSHLFTKIYTLLHVFPSQKLSSLISSEEFLWVVSWATHASSIAHSCPTLYNPMDCSAPGSSVHGILQARILEWTTSSSSRRSSRLTHLSCTGMWILTTEPATCEAPPGLKSSVIPRLKLKLTALTPCIFLSVDKWNFALLLRNDLQAHLNLSTFLAYVVQQKPPQNVLLCMWTVLSWN